MDLTVTTSRNKIDAVFKAAGVEEAKVKAVYPPSIKDPQHATEQTVNKHNRKH